MSDTRPILIGEANPYGSAPEYALYPYPERSAGGRLCRVIMGLDPHDYIRRFDRRNLCPQEWSMRVAREAAEQLMSTSAGRTIVLLGSKVCSAFDVSFEPNNILNNLGSSRFVILPHPSGLCRLWNQPGVMAGAHAVLREAGVLGPTLEGAAE